MGTTPNVPEITDVAAVSPLTFAATPSRWVR